MTDLYGGKILRVDLTRGEVATVPTERYAPRFIGGRGFNARLLYEAVDASSDPLGPENIVGLSAGPLSGTLYPGCSRTDVMCKSVGELLTGVCGLPPGCSCSSPSTGVGQARGPLHDGDRVRIFMQLSGG